MLLETFRSAITALNTNKIRSALTMLGVIIGVFSVVTMISLGRGVENYITDEFDQLGTNMIFISPGSYELTGDPASAFSENKLDEKHVDLIERYASESISSVTPMVMITETVEYKTNSFFSEVIGVNNKSLTIFNYVIDEGRVFSKTEERSGAKVAVIGPQVTGELFSGQSPIGQRIEVGDDSYEIIGTFEEKSSNYDDQIILPYTAMMETFDVKNFSFLVAKASDSNKISFASKQLEIALLRDLEEDEFTILSQEELLVSIQDVLGILTLGLGIIAGISLFVGGIGIMNIMLVSVTERIREIGLRKAVGATSYNIGIQFLAESVLISFGGGAIGLLLGFVSASIARQFIRTEVPLYAVFLAFGFSAFVGIVFGTYPAFQASKKNPIDALRYE